MDGDEWRREAIAEGLERGGAAHEIQVDAALRGRVTALNRMLDFATTHFGRKTEIFGGENGFLVRTTY